MARNLTYHGEIESGIFSKEEANRVKRTLEKKRKLGPVEPSPQLKAQPEYKRICESTTRQAPKVVNHITNFFGTINC